MPWLERGLRVTGGVFGARQVINTEIATPNSAVNKLDDIFKNNSPKLQAEMVTPNGFRVKVPQTDKPFQTTDDLILEARGRTNGDYANKKFPMAEYAEKMKAKYPDKAEIFDEIVKKYPNGVKFNAEGFPEFSPYSIKTVKINMKGNRTSDFTEANRAAGLKTTPKGYTWHHHQDRTKMELVPRDLHDFIRHDGGVSEIKKIGEIK